MPIARFINTKEIKDIFNERNPTNKIADRKAAKWREEWKAAHPGVKLPGDKVVPYQWFEEAFGEDVYQGLMLDDITLAKLDVLRLNENMSRSEFIGKIINEYKAKEKDVNPD